MNRRQFLTATASFAALPPTGPLLSAAEPAGDTKGVPTPNYKLTPPARGPIPVAVLISEGVNVIDFSGPWGVFDSVMIGGSGHEMHRQPFELFTVSD